MNSHHISRDRKIKKIIALGFCALVLLFVVPKFVSYTAALVMTPVHSLESWLLYSTDSFPYFIRERSVLVRELNELKYSQSAQSGDKLSSQMFSEENQQLRALLGEDGQRRIVAGIIGRPNALPYDVLVIDKGSKNGIVAGAPVFIGNNAVIGIVGKVFDTSAVITLVTTPGFTVSVYIFGPNIYTTATGIGGGQLKVGVPQGIKLEEGNLVILPGVDAGIYGAVSIVESIPTQPEQFGYVSPEIPLASLRLVGVGEVPLVPLTFQEAEEIVNKVSKTVLNVPIPNHILVTATTTSTTTPHATSSVHTP